MKTYFITYQDQASGSCDTETVYLRGGMKAAKEYARQQANGWLVARIVEI